MDSQEASLQKASWVGLPQDIIFELMDRLSHEDGFNLQFSDRKLKEIPKVYFQTPINLQTCEYMIHNKDSLIRMNPSVIKNAPGRVKEGNGPTPQDKRNREQVWSNFLGSFKKLCIYVGPGQYAHFEHQEMIEKVLGEFRGFESIEVVGDLLEAESSNKAFEYATIQDGYKALRELRLLRIDIASLERLSTKFPNLERLSFAGLESNSANALVEKLKKLPGLKHVDINDVPPSSNQARFTTFADHAFQQGYDGLGLSYEAKYYNIQNHHDIWPRLKYIRLFTDSGKTTMLLLQALNRNGLTALDLTIYDYSPEIEEISSFKSLEKLTLRILPSTPISFDDLERLKKLHLLRELEVAYYDRRWKTGISIFYDFPQIAARGMINGIDLDKFRRFLNAMKSLRVWQVQWPEEWNDNPEVLEMIVRESNLLKFTIRYHSTVAMSQGIVAQADRFTDHPDAMIHCVHIGKFIRPANWVPRV
ncbi:hypothetical protein BGW36DRAFT_364203 [Talaromyces proteolyticus]|uniref:F-box domain-containing protein n=1 Tax=Talaromyces proteolyticus TaxID=1131652 RepID=A0AAD4KGI9_9EURO|nr:uncharacterized protein BGW36DRAFT_364203 [Talaromyces proteolyticus]KAH8690635.1 hypothetical protein BGW36DRAFT_364203 [Talaromyces proteolyticus]